MTSSITECLIRFRSISISSKSFIIIDRSREIATTKMLKKKRRIREKESKQLQKGHSLETRDLNKWLVSCFNHNFS